MKFKLDENTPWILKQVIERDPDHRVDSVFHEKLCGTSDPVLLERCKRDQRILIALDTDFLNPALHPIDTLYGIVVFLSRANDGFFQRGR